jgi:PAS domain S-box-containing protein
MAPRPFLFGTLSSKVVFSLAVGTLASVLTIGVLAFSFSRAVLDAAVMRDQLESAKQTMDKIDRLLDERYIQIQAIAGERATEAFLERPASASRQEDDTKARISQLTVLTGPWDELLVADTSGRVRAATDETRGPVVGLDPVEHFAYQAALSGHAYASDLTLSPDTHEPTLLFAAPIRDDSRPKHPVVGVMMGQFSWAAISPILDDVTASAVLVNRERGVIASNTAYTGRRLELFTRVRARDLALELEGDKSSSLVLGERQSLLGEEALASFAVQQGYLSYRGNGWGLILEVPSRLAFASARRSATTLAATLAPVVAAAPATILLILVRLVLRPIRSLTSTVKAVAAGDLKQRVHVASADEIGLLGTSFNAMTEQLCDVYDSLEERVRTRTAEVAAERERLAVTLRSIGDGVITTDTDGRVLMVNRIAEQLAGWSEGEAIRRPSGEVLRILDEESRQPAADPVKEVLRTRAAAAPAGRTILVSRDGTERVVAHSGAPIRDGLGAIVGVVVVFRDMTETTKMEARLLQANKMETVGQLAGGIAHDLNNELTPICGYLDLALGDLPPGAAERKLLEEARHCAFRSVEVIQRLVAFSRRSSQKKTVIGLTDTLRELRDLLVRFLPSAIEVDLQCPGDLWPIVGNATELHTVFMNLAANARDAMPSGGHLAVRARNQVLEDDDATAANVPRQYVAIEFHDTGVGMTTETQRRIFEPFFTTKGESHGTGLGLFTALGVVKDHGGWIDVATEPGVGTQFRVCLPACAGAQPAASAPAVGAEEAPRGTETILFADDEERVRSVSQAFLERLGYRTLFAADGAEAVDVYRARRSEIDVVVLDVIMPKLQGPQAMKEILAIAPDAKVILISGYASGTSPEELMTVGAKAFVAKPYGMATLAQTLRAVLDSSAEAMPPRGQLETLRGLAANGNMRDIEEWTTHLDGCDAFVRRVRALARRFETRALLDLAERSLERGARA